MKAFCYPYIPKIYMYKSWELAANAVIKDTAILANDQSFVPRTHTEWLKTAYSSRSRVSNNLF